MLAWCLFALIPLTATAVPYLIMRWKSGVTVQFIFGYAAAWDLTVVLLGLLAEVLGWAGASPGTAEKLFAPAI